MQFVRAIVIFIVFLLTLFNSRQLMGLIKLDAIMSKEEQDKIGISKLSTAQKEQLEKWINEKFILKTKEAAASPLTLQENLQNGAQLQLSDGSIYAIAPSDQSKTSFWLTPIEIKISASQDPQYPFLLTNVLTGITVRAKQLQAPTIQPSTQQEL